MIPMWMNQSGSDWRNSMKWLCLVWQSRLYDPSPFPVCASCHFFWHLPSYPAFTSKFWVFYRTPTIWCFSFVIIWGTEQLRTNWSKTRALTWSVLTWKLWACIWISTQLPQSILISSNMAASTIWASGWYDPRHCGIFWSSSIHLHVQDVSLLLRLSLGEENFIHLVFSCTGTPCLLSDGAMCGRDLWACWHCFGGNSSSWSFL